MNDLDIILVKNKFFNSIDNHTLSKILEEWKKDYIYEIDGIITHDNIYLRENKNPKHAFAFKMISENDMQETTVMM